MKKPGRIPASRQSPASANIDVKEKGSVSCGVAEYRFGDGPSGVLADADKAMYAAKELSRRDSKSHVCYRNELTLEKPSPVAA